MTEKVLQVHPPATALDAPLGTDILAPAWGLAGGFADRLLVHSLASRP